MAPAAFPIGLDHYNSPTARCGQDQLVSVDKESHINVALPARG